MADLTQQIAHDLSSVRSQSIKIACIHPEFTSSAPILSLFLGDSTCLYVCFQPVDVVMERILERIDTSLEEQLHDEQLPQSTTIILDQVDVLPHEQLELLLLHLRREAPGALLVIFSRHMPACLFENPELRQQSRIVPQGGVGFLGRDATTSGQSTLLEVRALGSNQVILNGRPVLNWDGALPRDLFFFLVDRAMATRNEIFEAFWPNLPIKEATNVFHVTKRKISEVLGVDLTTYSSNFYRISPEIDVRYDVLMFRDAVVNSAVLPPAEAKPLLLRAINAYRGPFLAQLLADNVWVQQRRDELNQLYGEALIALAKLYQQEGERERALGLYLRATATNPQREDVAGSIMTLYVELGQPERALDVYNNLERALADTLGISPAQWLQDLAANIRSHVPQTIRIVLSS